MKAQGVQFRACCDRGVDLQMGRPALGLGVCRDGGHSGVGGSAGKGPPTLMTGLLGGAEGAQMGAGFWRRVSRPDSESPAWLSALWRVSLSLSPPGPHVGSSPAG